MQTKSPAVSQVTANTKTDVIAIKYSDLPAILSLLPEVKKRLLRTCKERLANDTKPSGKVRSRRVCVALSPPKLTLAREP